MKKLLIAAGLLALAACSSQTESGMRSANPQPQPSPQSTPNGGNPMGAGSSSVPGGATESTQ